VVKGKEWMSKMERESIEKERGNGGEESFTRPLSRSFCRLRSTAM